MRVGAGPPWPQLKANEAERLVASLTPGSPMEVARHAVAHEHLEDLRRVDAELADSRKRIIEAVAVSGTAVTDIAGVGTIVAAMVTATPATCTGPPGVTLRTSAASQVAGQPGDAHGSAGAEASKQARSMAV